MSGCAISLSVFSFGAACIRPQPATEQLVPGTDHLHGDGDGDDGEGDDSDVDYHAGNGDGGDSDIDHHAGGNFNSDLLYALQHHLLQPEAATRCVRAPERVLMKIMILSIV